MPAHTVTDHDATSPLGSRTVNVTMRLAPGASVPSWTRMAAGVALVMVLSLQLGAGAMFRYAYLMDASGLPLVGGLVALMIGGGRGKVKSRK